MNRIYNTNDNIKLDTCWANSKDMNNKQIENYTIYYNDTVREEHPFGTLPTFANDHVNLRGRPGYGLTEDYLVDTYSTLRNNVDGSTRDRCPVQLVTRMFKGNPKLRGQSGNINRELDLLSGSDTRTTPVLSNADETMNTQPFRCNKSIMEMEFSNFMPLLDNVLQVQNPNNIIMPTIRGGEDTRSYENKLKFNKCNKKSTV